MLENTSETVKAPLLAPKVAELYFYKFCTVEVWRTELVKNHFKVKNYNCFDFSKTVAKMLFLSVSRESIGILTIFRKTFFAQLLLVAEIG